MQYQSISCDFIVKYNIKEKANMLIINAIKFCTDNYIKLR